MRIREKESRSATAPAYLLAWNPRNWRWGDFTANVRAIATNGFFEDQWSCGNTQSIPPGVTFYLIRLGPVARGIIGAGQTTSSPFYAPHWDETRTGDTLYVRVRFNLLTNEPAIHWSELQQPPFNRFQWAIQKSGVRLPADIANIIDTRLTRHRAKPSRSAEELDRLETYPEGARARITVNAYERSQQARAACIARFGTACAACDVELGSTYGPIAQGYIHVHHVVPLSSAGTSYVVDPARDLRPLCPNCHAVAHLASPPLSVRVLRQLIRENRGLTLV